MRMQLFASGVTPSTYPDPNTLGIKDPYNQGDWQTQGKFALKGKGIKGADCKLSFARTAPGAAFDIYIRYWDVALKTWVYPNGEGSEHFEDSAGTILINPGNDIWFITPANFMGSGTLTVSYDSDVCDRY